MTEENNSNKKNLIRSLNKESIELLEWEILKKHLSTFASTEMCKKSILKFEIPSIFENSHTLLNETLEIRDLENELDKQISFSDIYDIKEYLEICIKGGVIGSESLLQIAETISASR